jgi:glycosyltransferase A (GT-A) superfamily protein (DUF2064 family)/2-polyprenyl-3-methyl-5-hydroxy-6-metoxy-1,4-benzoquinol methylase
MMERAEIVAVLAKEPKPGRVKTRLQSRFTPDEAAELATAAVRDTQRAIRASSIPRRILCWDGDPSDFAGGFEVVPQRTGTLNDRLIGAFRDIDRQDPARVLLIGMDTPQVSSALLDADWEGCDAVLGLSDDGGFWAIGLRTADAGRVFAGIEMSSSRTGSAQLARLLSLGRSVKLLLPLRDIDEPEDAAYIAARYPDLEFSRRHAALTRTSRPELIFDHLYAGNSVRSDTPGARVLPLETRRWSDRADDVDQLVVSRCRSPVLDLGCGPGRMVQALNESGLPALGVDMSAMAVEVARSRGALAIQARLAERLPAEGRWGTVLLMDGNIGIDGDVGALLRRCRALLAPGGTIIVEVDPRPAWHQTRRVHLSTDIGGYSADLVWTRTGATAVRRLAGQLDLLVVEEWTADGRAFLSLQAAA